MSPKAPPELLCSTAVDVPTLPGPALLLLPQALSGGLSCIPSGENPQVSGSSSIRAWNFYGQLKYWALPRKIGGDGKYTVSVWCLYPFHVGSFPRVVIIREFS